MRKLRLDIEYEGTEYHGWQIQDNAVTVSGTIEVVLEQILQHPARLIGSGRTDAGVHALGQVAHLETERAIPAKNLQRALNRLLPHDIVIRRAQDVPLEFHARRDAIERYYRYQLYVGLHPSALYRNLTYFVPQTLDLEAMRRAAEVFVGTHDFSAFRSAHCGAPNPERTIRTFEIIDQTPFVFLDVRANAFLQNQVRIMAGTLLQVGKGKIKVDEIQAILDSKDRKQAALTLKPRGLILMEVKYPES